MRIFLLCLLIGVLSVSIQGASSSVLYENDFETGFVGWSRVVPELAPESMWEQQVQPTLAAQCGSCHLGERFGITTLEREGAQFTAQETARNRDAFLRMVSFDYPPSSRLLAKLLPRAHPRQVDHGGGALLSEGDGLYNLLLQWIQAEKVETCPDCGTTSPRSFLAWVEQPREFWAIPREPDRPDWGLRTGAQIKVRAVSPKNLQPQGPTRNFLPTSFCPSGECDYGQIASSFDGSRVAFECRKSVAGEPVFEQAWNLCVAEVAVDGTAQNPRFLLPQDKRHKRWTQSRTSPFGLYTQDGEPLRGQYDLFFELRRRSDLHPTFSPDNHSIFFSSRGPDPLTGIQATRTYHGFEHVNHIVGVRVGGPSEGTGWTRPYLNEGGVADYPLFLRNGRLAFHTWNLERTDRHMYQQTTLEGNGTLPVLFGRLQGPNQWERFTELENGMLLGITGRRRADLERYVPFVADHTLGTGDNINPTLENWRILDESVHAQIAEFGFCDGTQNGPNCRIDRYYSDPSWAPNGKALIAYAANGTYAPFGHVMYGKYGSGNTSEEVLASLDAYVPQDLGIATIDHRGQTSTVISPPAGKSLRYPVWIGKRRAPADPGPTPNGPDSSVLHIADVPVWLTLDFQDSGVADHYKSGVLATLDQISALRVLVKELGNNACTSDSFAYRHAVNNDQHDHPTHLGIYNSTGYRQLMNPAGSPGGDIPLESDRSVKLRLPAETLLLFQGIDDAGHVVMQKSRLFSLNRGGENHPGVKRTQYRAQCSACHGAIESPEGFHGLTRVDQLPTGALDQNTQANAKNPVDLSEGSSERLLTWRHALRPILNNKCTSCHSGTSPAGELTLESEYSSSANYPAGKWATQTGLFNPAYLNSVPQNQRVAGYNWSVSHDWYLQRADSEYQNAPEYASKRAAQQPIGELAPWDPGYQALHARSTTGDLLYLADDMFAGHMGRSSTLLGNSRRSFLAEVLTGQDLDPSQSYSGYDHSSLLSEEEKRLLFAVLDIGFPYMARCDDQVIPSGPNAGEFWGDPVPVEP